MILRRAEDRGHFQNHWLNTRYSFSFADYYDPAHMGFHALRVINDDIVAPGAGFPTHGHRDMEIISYIVDGAIAHKDSMGNVETLQAGEVQVMSAGKGVQHSEFNPLADKPLRLIQIWIEPDRRGIAPGYAQRPFTREEKLNRLCLLASPDAANGSLRIQQNARAYASLLEAGRSLEQAVDAGRAAWLQVVGGRMTVNGQDLKTGDGLAIEGPAVLKAEALEESEWILFDLERRRP